MTPQEIPQLAESMQSDTAPQRFLGEDNLKSNVQAQQSDNRMLTRAR